MGTQNPSAPSRAQSAVGGNPTRSRHHGGGIIHENTRHTTRFVVIGNHLVQHPELSLLAIGLGCHIQSLPTGTPTDIKSLAARFKEGATRIAAALRELEAHGYLRRERVRTPAGRIVTRTVSCNQPGATRHRPEPARKPHTEQRPPRKKRALPAVPQPSYPSPTLLQQATDLLAGLRRLDPRLLLSACDTTHLAPGVAAWLEREVTPTAVRHALTADLPPEDLRRPAALVAHRLTAQLPPPPPYRAPAAPPPVLHPLQNCDGCDRGIRAPEPGARCRDCRSDLPEDA
ncbi:helix-turn-helix domain-containing protein [Streptomyces sp. TRM S81-3]|uniref:Helix-turn-helix domain-containing protein n=1 Tax=Streptomyces griseicoloratus TaxID=2752516 RepID=A0A926L9W7_9ACTN|nr:helix-turn-helix domain-containing protein [Streptomyces griseicoloratus]MBD0422991.1 helix-turn-helix domain-containing protein [Streptomyces griseicoloratus]